jgi:enoyl-CoA hydratase
LIRADNICVLRSEDDVRDAETEYSSIRLDNTAGIALITVDRPQVMNALNDETIAELTAAFESIARDPAIKGAVLTGSGDRAFIAGADIAGIAAATPIEAERKAAAGQQLFNLIEGLGKPVVAAVNGVALGGGCEAALACTFRIAVPGASFGQPEVKLGLIPGFGGTQRLPRLVGRALALRLILTGDPIGAQEAARTGLVDEIVEPSALLDRARALVMRVAANAPVAVRFALEAVNASGELPLNGGLALERRLFALCASTADKAEGTAAFLAKRKPTFVGS